MALYHDKANGRNDFCLFQPAMEEEFLELRALENALRTAIEKEEQEVYYQPIVDLRTGRTKSCEALLRWHHAESNSLIREFQKIGLKLSIDDFGTGYSSLTYLKKYAFDKIKIDTTFIADVTKSREARAIINALVGLAAELEMDIVAEGIETETQLGYVTGAHCTAAQGFYLGRPMPGADIKARLESEWRESKPRAVPDSGKVRRLRA